MASMFDLRPLDLSANLNAFQGLAQSNSLMAQRADQARREHDAKRAGRMRLLGALAGGAVGSSGGLAGASIGANIGGQVGGAVGGAPIDPVALGQAGLQGASYMQGQSAQETKAARGVETAGLVSSALNPPQERPNPEDLSGMGLVQPLPNIQGALSALAANPDYTGAAVTGSIQKSLADQQAAVTVRGQDITAGVAREGQLLKQQLHRQGYQDKIALAGADRDFKATIAAEENSLKRELSAEELSQKRWQFQQDWTLKFELQEMKVLQQNETPGKYMVRLLQKKAGGDKLSRVEEDSLLFIAKSSNPLYQEWTKENFPELFPTGAPKSAGAGGGTAGASNATTGAASANAAIAAGADAEAVRKKYKDTYGVDLP